MSQAERTVYWMSQAAGLMARMRKVYDLCTEAMKSDSVDGRALVTRILAAMAEPVKGVFLTPEEAMAAVTWYRTHPNGSLFPPFDDAVYEKLRKAAGK